MIVLCCAMLRPVMLTVPPLLPDTSSVPVRSTTPPLPLALAALIMIAPSASPTLCARSVPLLVMRLLTMLAPAAAVSAIVPPSAWMVPVLLTSCELTASLTATDISPSP